jgi:hypothetical protein
VSRPERQADADTVRALARYAGLPVIEADAARRLEGLQTALAITTPWAAMGLGYSFDPDGGFGYAQMIAQHIPAWDVPTGLNKGGVLVERDGDVTLEDA